LIFSEAFQRIWHFIRNERGNVESSLVLIPLLTLFLITTQLTIAIHARNMSSVTAQDSASVEGVSGNFSPSDTFIHINSPDPDQNLDLVVSHRSGVLLRLVPGLSEIMHGKPVTDVSGIAVIENRQ
jgi:hypothetical protein